MKIIATLFSVITLTASSFAQTVSVSSDAFTTDTAVSKPSKRSSKWFDYSKNIVKLNLTSLTLNNYAVSYERLVGRKISVTGAFRYMPNTKLTKTLAGRTVLDILGDDGKDLQSLSAGNSTVTAGVRFYTGNRAGAKGVYAEIYGRYGNFKLDYDYSFRSNGKDYRMLIHGNTNVFGGGLLIGAQFTVYKKIFVDIYIIGAHYGKVNGNIDGVSDLSTMSASEKKNMQDDINKIGGDIVSKDFIKAEVNNNGVKGKLDGPFIGARSFGISIGYGF